MYFAQFLRNQVEDGFVFDQGPTRDKVSIGGMIGLAANPWQPEEMPVAVAAGIVIRGNRLNNYAPIVLRTGTTKPETPSAPAILYGLIEDNQIDNVTPGMEVGPGTRGVVVRGNRYAGAGTALLDAGVGTVAVESSVR
jgi:hypothetical protein